MNQATTEQFKHKYPIEIRFADVDAMGHVNNAKYLTYIEQARIRYMNAAIQVPIQWGRQGLILARIEHDFVKPAVFEDKMFVYTRCSSIGNKSFVLEYLLARTLDTAEEIIGRSMSVLVTYDYDKGQSMPIPEIWKTSIRQFEGTEQTV